MLYELCMDCDYCKTDRKNEQGQVRCTRFSRFVNANNESCKEFQVEGNKEHGILRLREGAE